ncbi:NADH-quinone oxidoreductase subunit J [Buchnera aphidicola]|uniref:NADH-quinone oxidoreductase subunit J n=1 Tax=Buchnera aphidicola TaxID=9 RepID=UPI0031B87D95
MKLIFFLSSFVLFISIFFIIFGNNLLYSTLFLIISFLSTSVIFFLLGSYLSGFFQVIIYSGAILLLFIFVVMIIKDKNKNFIISISMKRIFKIFLCFLICGIFIIDIIYPFLHFFDFNKSFKIVSPERVGKILFSDYFFVIELSSILMLEALILSFYFNKSYKDFHKN